jgi:hypothetical protein
MNHTTLLLIIAGAVVALIAYAAQRKKGGDIKIPPAPQRSDLYFGPYGYWDVRQLAETKGWTNLFWVIFRQGNTDNEKADAAIACMKTMGCAAALDVSAFLYEGTEQAPTPTADGEARLRNVLTRMQAAGVLAQVKMLMPRDEPNGAPTGMDALPVIVPMIRRVAAEFPELTKVLVGSSFTTIRPWGHLELFDVVGCDEYSAKSSILGPGGALERLRNDCKNGQRFVLFPGASMGQSITPFLNYANGHADVWGIVYFLHRLDPAEGIETALPDQPALYTEYQAAGRQIVGVKAA